MLSDKTIKLIEKNNLNIKVFIVKLESVNRLGESLGFKYLINVYQDYKLYVVEEIIHMCSSLRLTEKDDNIREYEFNSVESAEAAVDYLVNDFLKEPVTHIYSLDKIIYNNY